jgi:hypothetical protein
MNVEIGTEAAQFLLWEYIKSNLFAVPHQFDDILRIILHRSMSCGYSSTPSGLLYYADRR